MTMQRRQFHRLLTASVSAASFLSPVLVHAQAKTVLRAGDQKGGLRALLEAAGELKDKIVLVGTTAPGLQDLRTAPLVLGRLSAVNGEELRRSYSICAGVDDGELREVYHYRPAAGVAETGDDVALVIPYKSSA